METKHPHRGNNLKPNSPFIQSSKVLVAEETFLVRLGLVNTIEKNRNYNVVGECWHASKAINLLEKYEPQIIFVGVSLEPLDGRHLSAIIKSQWPEIKTIALACLRDDQLLKSLDNSIFDAILSSDTGSAEIFKAMATVMAGGRYYSPNLARSILDRIYGNVNTNHPLEDLTEREGQVLHLISDGLTTKEVASQIGLSVKTIDVHRRNILQKLGARNTAQLVKIAIQNQLLSI